MSKITVNGITINPEAPQTSSFLAGLAPESLESNYILVQTDGPLTGEQRHALADLGVELLEYVPDNTYICHSAGADLETIRALPFVDWANAYLQGFKIAPQLRTDQEARAGSANLLDLGEVPTSMSQEPQQVIVVLHKDVDPEDVRESIAEAARLNPQSLNFAHNAVRLVVQPQDLEDLAQIDGVRHIEAYAAPKLLNNVALGILRAEHTHNGPGLQGDGEIIAVCDTGFDRGSLNDVHPAFNGRVRKLYRLGRPATANDPHGHGTHVAGSALGDGQSATMGGAIRGAAPRAALVLQSVFDDLGGLGGLPDDLGDLLRVPYEDDGARVHTNSWGVRSAAWLGRYTANAEQIDRFVWEHRDYVVCFSAGNEGSDANADGVVDSGSITPPATAKNCITVGATENSRPAGAKSYGDPWPGDFPVDPLASDNWSDNPEGIAAFSSRGPTQNGRIKPDVVAPGTAILSTHSRDAHVGQFWGTSTDGLFAFMGGTSMAAPLVAGCAAVVRQHLRRESGNNPSAALVKAMLINGARDATGQYVPTEAGGLPNFSEGFGRVDLAATVGPLDDGQTLTIRDEAMALDTGESESLTVTVGGPGTALKATLVWSDPPGEALQNDLDLIVRAGGQERHGNMPADSASFDRTNNVEQVVWDNIPEGQVTIVVRAHRVTLHPQSYALVVRHSGAAGDDGEPPQPPSDVTLSVDDVQLAQLSSATLEATVDYSLGGADAAALAATRAPVRLSVSLARRDPDGPPVQAATADHTLQPGVTAYSRALTFAMPRAGRYRMICRVEVDLADRVLRIEDDSLRFRVIYR